MAEDNDQVINNDVTDDNVNVDDSVNDDAANQDTIEDEDKTESEKKQTLVDKIRNVLKRSPDNAGDDTESNDTETDSSGGSDTQVTDDDIPDEFVEVAKDANWTDQQIIDHAKKYSNADLMAQITFLQKQDSDTENSSDKSDDTDKSSGESKEKSGESDENADDVKDEVIKKLEARIATLEQNEQKKNDDDATKELVAMAQRATAMMDELSEQYDGVFGTYDELPRFPDGTVIPNSPENLARNQVWGLVRTLTDAGTDFDTAMSISLNAFKGEHLEKSAERNLAVKLKRSAKKVSPKRHSTSATTKAKDLAGVVREGLKKHGRV
jgi:hypothetical protein